VKHSRSSEKVLRGDSSGSCSRQGRDVGNGILSSEFTYFWALKATLNNKLLTKYAHVQSFIAIAQ